MEFLTKYPMCMDAVDKSEIEATQQNFANKEVIYNAGVSRVLEVSVNCVYLIQFLK